MLRSDSNSDRCFFRDYKQVRVPSPSCLYRRQYEWKNRTVALATVGFVIFFICVLPFRHACLLNDFVQVSHVGNDLMLKPIAAVRTGFNVCSLSPHGKLPDLPLYSEVIKLEDVESLSTRLHILPGGQSKQTACQSQIATAIIVPYRDRPEQLRAFLWYMHQFLSLQRINYTIYIVEQSEKYRFNRAKLFNIGFVEALKFDRETDCFIFHDADLLPENVLNIYGCSRQPRHLVSALNTFRYNLPYCSLFGGAIAMTRQQFLLVNGFSNRFFGWGGEDDDLSGRVHAAGYSITRWDPAFARYSTMVHKKETPNPDRYNLLMNGNKFFQEDGVTSVQYKVLKREKRPLYTWILAEL